MPSSLTVINAHSRISSSNENDNRIIQQAISLLEHRLFAQGPLLQSPQDAQDYLRLTLMPEPNEVFVACFLSSRHQVIACETLFRGTIDSATIHPRVVIQRALERNSSALIISHYVARHIMRVMCPVFLCALLGRSEPIPGASEEGQAT